MPGWVNDSSGNARLIETLKVYNGAGNVKTVIGGWAYDGAGNARNFAGQMLWTMDFSGPNNACGGRTGPCASTITYSCFTPMGSVTQVSGTPPAAAFKLAHVKTAAPAASDQFILWLASASADNYVLTSRITSVGGQPENATVVAHVYDANINGYGYLFGQLTRVIQQNTVYRIVFSA